MEKQLKSRSGEQKTSKIVNLNVWRLSTDENIFFSLEELNFADFCEFSTFNQSRKLLMRKLGANSNDYHFNPIFISQPWPRQGP